jgi:predicted ATPase
VARRRLLARPPYLTRAWTPPERIRPGEFPFTIESMSRGLDVKFSAPVTFFVGENGSGKSTLMEAIAEHAGFSLAGGKKAHQIISEALQENESVLARRMKIAWLARPAHGFFLRAESFYNFSQFIDEQGDPGHYGGRPLLGQSHGESFLSLFQSQFRDDLAGLYLMDEPEAALSPSRQLTLLRILHDMEQAACAQFVIATHSPILLAYPGAEILEFRQDGIAYRDTEHFKLTREFLENPERYLRYLFADDEEQ